MENPLIVVQLVMDGLKTTEHAIHNPRYYVDRCGVLLSYKTMHVLALLYTIIHGQLHRPAVVQHDDPKLLRSL